MLYAVMVVAGAVLVITGAASGHVLVSAIGAVHVIRGALFLTAPDRAA